MWLEWEPAAMVVFILVGAVIALRPVATRWADVVGAFAASSPSCSRSTRSGGWPRSSR